MIPTSDAYVLSRLLAGGMLNGELVEISRRFRNIAKHLNAMPPEGRLPAWEGFLCSHPDPDIIIRAVADADPTGPPPEAGTGMRYATVADLRRLLSTLRWTWDGYIPAARVFGIAGFEGTGKTRLALDLHRRAYLGLTWPDNQAIALPPGRPVLWLCADGNQDELADLLSAFKLPDESIIFPAPPEEPYAGTDLDSAETLAAVEGAIRDHNPWCVFIDTLTNATHRNLCAQDEMKALKEPLMHWTQTFGVNVGLLLHLSREGEVLGRRIKGITRTTIHLECPDPEAHPERLRLWVSKSFAKKPPALGVTMGDGGNAYDHEPPTRPEPSRGGRPPESREKAKRFIRESLARQNDRRATELCGEWTKADKGNSESAFWRARDEMVEDGELVCEGKPLVMHLNRTEAEAPVGRDPSAV